MVLHLLGLSEGVQWVMCMISWGMRTDRFYDLTGSLTFLFLTSFSYLSSPSLPSSRKDLLSLMVIIWAIRLGSFLGYRIHSHYHTDPRFTRALKNFKIFFIYWNIQGLWVFLTALPVYLVNFSSEPAPLTVWDLPGFALWLFGFLFETIADYQKFSFRLNNPNKKKFIKTGLWGKCQHPNYFGEIVLWWGVFLSSLSSLQGWQFLAIISPVFVTYLLTRVSGIPLLQKQYKEKYGDDPEYQKYKKETPLLFPKLF